MKEMSLIFCMLLGLHIGVDVDGIHVSYRGPSKLVQLDSLLLLWTAERIVIAVSDPEESQFSME